MQSPAPSFRRRGSAMIVVILVAAIVAISLTSYVHLSLNSLNLADRSFHTQGAVNLAELGLEEALYCYNRLGSVSTPADAWTGWTLSGSTAKRTFTGFAQGPNSTGSIKVYCENYNPALGATPAVVAQSTVTLPRGKPITKMLEIKVKRRSLFPSGMVGRDTVELGGWTVVDAWNSDPDNNPATAPVPYSSGVRKDKGFAATASTAAGALDVAGSGGVDIYGRIASGGGSVVTNSKTKIQIATSPASPLIDPALITADFSATFPAIAAPAATVVNVISADITDHTTLPRVGDLVNTDGRYYYQFNAGTGIVMGSDKSITFNAKTTFLFKNHAGAWCINLGSNNRFTMNGTYDLQIYTNGDIRISSNVIINNTREPAACQIFGTNPTANAQTILIDANGIMNAVIYSPNAFLEVKSNGVLSGGAAVYRIKSSSDATFHCDEALKAGTGSLFGLLSWREMRTSTERATYASQLSF